MNIINGYPVCNNCKYSTLHYCKKFNKECLSVFLSNQRCQLICLDCANNDSYEQFNNDENKILEPSKIGYFHLPGIENLELFMPLITMRKYYPEIFFEDRQISELYGAFPGTIWNGRTPNFGGASLCMQDIDNIRKKIESLGLSVNLTWNNHLISGTDVYDRFCNNITEVFHNGKHAITVASDELFKYLKEKYPNFKYYKSVITTELDKTFLENQDYDMLLMNRKLNNDWNELLKIPENKRSNIEFLCNDACTPICNRMGHYNIVNRCLKDRLDEGPYIQNYCTIDHDFINFNRTRWPMSINSEDIDNYIKHNFIHFKLCSRNDTQPILALKVIKYLVKPQYIDDAFEWCINSLTMPEEQFKGEGNLEYDKITN